MLFCLTYVIAFCDFWKRVQTSLSLCKVFLTKKKTQTTLVNLASLVSLPHVIVDEPKLSQVVAMVRL